MVLAEHTQLEQNLIFKNIKMKKTIYFLMMFIGLAITGCEPMEDIHEEVNAELEARSIEGVAEVRLTEDDYTEDVEDGGLGLNFPNFSSLDEARALIPTFLENNYPVWGEGSLALVTFDLYDPVVVEEHTVPASGYEVIGLDDNYFSGMDEIAEYLSYQFPQADNGSFVELTYRTIPEEIEYEFNDDDFDLIGLELADVYSEPAASAAQYNNFDRREGRDAYWSNEMILDAINVVLSENFDDVEGQTYQVSYAIYDGSSGVESMDVMFDGNSYVRAGATIYELTSADFDLIGEELGDTYPAPAANAAQYNSFGVVEDSNTYWSDSMILEAINIVLQEQFPTAAEGDEFVVNYKVFTGSTTVPTSTSVILNGGQYVVDDTPPAVSTIVETSVFAYTNGDWGTPLALPRSVYQEEFAQRYANFDDEETAGFYIARYIEPMFPYAQEGDYVAVAYNFYNGERTVTNYANFVYRDGEFNYVPSVVEETLQFGHDGEGWEPDNTIVYNMTEADYAAVGEALADEYPDPAWSVGNFSNFDRRVGNRNYWSQDMLVEAMNVVLDRIHPGAEEGQKYVVNFDIYDGSAGTESLSLIKEEGEWVLNE